MFSFNCVNLGWEGLTASGAYVAAAVDLDENYSNVEAELGSILRAMDAIVHNKGVATVNHPTLEGKKLQVNVEFLLCADYKFLLLLFGMKGANGKYPCVWCCADSDHLGEAGEPRDIKKMNAQFRRGGGPGLKHLALFKYLDVKRVFLDPLHLTLRVFDKLLKALVEEVRNLDEPGAKTATIGPRLKALQDAINQSHVGFSFYFEKGDSNGGTSNKLDWTSLTGGSRKRVLAELPALLDLNILGNAGRQARIAETWKTFNKCMQFLHVPWRLSNREIDRFETLVGSFTKSWMDLKKENESVGYGKLTPYMHAMVHHLPGQLREIGSGLITTCQPTERINDIARHFVRNRSNMKNVTRDILEHVYKLKSLESEIKALDDMESEAGVPGRKSRKRHVAAGDVVAQAKLIESLAPLEILNGKGFRPADLRYTWPAGW